MGATGPLDWPKATISPLGRTDRRLASKVARPTESKTTSTPPGTTARTASTRSERRWLMTCSTPSPRRYPALASDEVLASTVTPCRMRNCTSSDPVPPAAAWTSAHSSGTPWRTSWVMAWAVMPCSSTAAASLDVSSSGTGTRTSWGTAGPTRSAPGVRLEVRGVAADSFVWVPREAATSPVTCPPGCKDVT
jgi:hypothetical protein